MKNEKIITTHVLTKVSLPTSELAEVAKLFPLDTELNLLHKLAWTFFPGTAERDYLLRFNEVSEGWNGWVIWVMSKTEPKIPSYISATAVRTTNLSFEFNNGNRYIFSIKCNPTYRDSASHTRQPHRTLETQLAWFKRKAQENGFEIEEETLSMLNGKVYNSIRDGENLDHQSIEFKGMLTVTDPKKFVTAYTQGIGASKAYGFGLLLLIEQNQHIRRTA